MNSKNLPGLVLLTALALVSRTAPIRAGDGQIARISRLRDRPRRFR